MTAAGPARTGTWGRAAGPLRPDEPRCRCAGWPRRPPVPVRAPPGRGHPLSSWWKA